jgi:hypothetical protein
MKGEKRMKTSVDRFVFIGEMDYYYRNKFSYDGLNALYDYLIELEKETGEEIELDVKALHSKYSEMSIYDFIRDFYSNDIIEEILNIYNLNFIEEITVNVLYEYECLYGYNRIVCIIDEHFIIVDNDR